MGHHRGRRRKKTPDRDVNGLRFTKPSQPPEGSSRLMGERCSFPCPEHRRRHVLQPPARRPLDAVDARTESNPRATGETPIDLSRRQAFTEHLRARHDPLLPRRDSKHPPFPFVHPALPTHGIAAEADIESGERHTENNFYHRGGGERCSRPARLTPARAPARRNRPGEGTGPTVPTRRRSRRPRSPTRAEEPARPPAR